MTKRLVLLSVLTGLVLAMWVLPAAAQEEVGPFYEENGDVEPIVVERDEPAPRVEVEHDRAPSVEQAEVTEVDEVALAVTGVPVTVGSLLAIVLLALGVGAVITANRRRAKVDA